ncbi:MAG TPA: glycosyltransferase family 2 protein [Vicinamibacterales bacterium]|nr:glycosyltransferase family 2 protein [Vicinamibacterales bacterium]
MRGGNSGPDISIVLITWNAYALTAAALASIPAAAPGLRCEILVVDNGSADNSVARLREAFPDVTVIENGWNAGFAAANNIAIRASTGHRVLVLNNDTVLAPESLARAVDYLDLHPEVGALGILHLNADEARTPQGSCFAFPRPHWDVGSLCGLQVARGVDRGPWYDERDVDWICGSFMLIPRRCLDQVGLFDERFFIYDEDIDWCRRARSAGWTVRFWPGAHLVHRGAAAQAFMRDKTFVHFRSRLAFLRKHHPLWAPAYYFAMAARLTLATTRQAVAFIAGRTTWRAVRERFDRQRRFVGLRHGSHGG